MEGLTDQGSREDLTAETSVPVHAAPTGVLMPCCRRTVFEVPRSDRISVSPREVTCEGRPPE